MSVEVFLPRECAPRASLRDVWGKAALAVIPKILTLQDRDPHSPTFGCFDRNYWHYRTIDFPSGMAEEFVWPLALAYDSLVPGNPYFGREAVRSWVIGGLSFAARHGRRDGSTDDYYRFERAAGAAAFSLLAIIEAARLVRALDGEVLGLVERRARWLATHDESGQLSNHQALIALGLLRAGEVLGTDEFEYDSRRRVERLLAWQHPEGWFPEYQGCDPGYLTLTIGALAQLSLEREVPGLEAALERAVDLVAELMHPDGTVAGELGSRSTHAFFPHGFELLGPRLPRALAINDLARGALLRGRTACHEDDHLVGHHAWSWLLAWRAHVAERPAALERAEGRHWYPHAGFLVDRRGRTELYLSTHKGGSFTLFRDGERVASDTQISLEVEEGGKLRNAVGHLFAPAEVQVEQHRVVLSGRLAWARRPRMTTPRLLILRAVMLGPGRFAPNLIRALLQILLITGREPAPFHFRRTLRWDGSRWRVRDELLAACWSRVRRAGIGGHQTSTYVVMSRVFAEGQLEPWLELTEDVRALARGEALVIERAL